MLKGKAAIIAFSATALLLIYSASLYFVVPPLALKKAKSVAAQHGYQLQVARWKSSGINKISFDSLLIIDSVEDTLVSASKGRIGFSVFRYVSSRLPVVMVSMDTISVFVKLKRDSSAIRTEEETESQIRSGWAARLFRLENKIIRNLPEKISVNRAEIRLKKNQTHRQILVENFNSDNSGIQALVQTGEGAGINLSASPIKKSGGYEFKADMKPGKFIPATMDSNALLFSFQTISASVTKNHWSSQKISAGCHLKTEGLQFYHWRISQDTVNINRFEARQNFTITENRFTTHPSSRFFINAIGLKNEVTAEKNDRYAFSLKAEIPVMPAQSFFSSLPDGLFSSFKGIKAEGELSYHFNFSVDMAFPDSLIFESALNGKKLKILQFGHVNPYRLNEPFEHTVYEKGKPVRRIWVGFENPFFTPLAQLNPALINCVITAEDGSFFGHAGFNEEAFRQSVITNIKERRFARGGSTISMQLVKNLYLGRDKNISRKMEEALWVWLIENKRMVSKERMMEIYLNIIEWGPDVYGIGEAALYYFNKKPDKLTLNECIFLAGIIPNPKYFRFAFDKEGNLRSYFQSFYRIVSERLLLKEKITEEEFSSVSPSIKLTGRASEWVMPSDSIPDFNAEEPDEEELP